MTRSEEWNNTYGSLGAPTPRLMQLPLDALDPWQSEDGQQQPFKPYPVNQLEELAENIRRNGVIEPVSVRPKPDGRFEILAGHNRCNAAKLAGLVSVPALVQELDDDQAAVLLVDSNLQHREKLLPSERAFAYKLRMDSIKRQGQRTDLTSVQLGQKLTSRELVAEDVRESATQIQRYIRLTYLIPPLLDMVDAGKIKVNPGVELSHLPMPEQTQLLQAIEDADKIPTGAMCKALRKASGSAPLDTEAILRILLPPEAGRPQVLKLPCDQLQRFFPPNTPLEEMERLIFAALAEYQKNAPASL